MDIQKAAQETYNNLHESVVLVIGRTSEDAEVSTGSGFIVGKTNRGYLVMTCEHVLGSHSMLRVRIPNEDKDTKEYEAKVVERTSKENETVVCSSVFADLALIEVYGLTRECKALEFWDPKAVEDVAPETVVFVLGYLNMPSRKGEPSTLNLTPAVCPGTINTPVKEHGIGVIQDVEFTTISIHGASGCPLILDGKVLGVNAEMEWGSHTCYARSVNTVNTLLKDWLRIAPEETRTTKELIEALCS